MVKIQLANPLFDMKLMGTGISEKKKNHLYNNRCPSIILGTHVSHGFVVILKKFHEFPVIFFFRRLKGFDATFSIHHHPYHHPSFHITTHLSSYTTAIHTITTINLPQLTRSPFWNIWHRDNGRVSNGVLVDPEYSNDWSWPDGHPSISFGPHGMGMDVARLVVVFFFSGWLGVFF